MPTEYTIPGPSTIPPSIGGIWAIDASNGGRGSLGFEDPDRFGARGLKSSEAEVIMGLPIVPGGGGGARPMPLIKHGSHAPGYSPEGVVVLRIFKVA